MKQLGKQLISQPLIPSVIESRGSKPLTAKPATEMESQLDILVSITVFSQWTSLRLILVLTLIRLLVFQVTTFQEDYLPIFSQHSSYVQFELHAQPLSYILLLHKP
jgi:hypothetical protein